MFLLLFVCFLYPGLECCLNCIIAFWETNKQIHTTKPKTSAHKKASIHFVLEEFLELLMMAGNIQLELIWAGSKEAEAVQWVSFRKGSVYLLWVLLAGLWFVKPALNGLFYLDLMTHEGLWICFVFFSEPKDTLWSWKWKRMLQEFLYTLEIKRSIKSFKEGHER